MKFLAMFYPSVPGAQHTLTLFLKSTGKSFSVSNNGAHFLQECIRDSWKDSLIGLAVLHWNC